MSASADHTIHEEWLVHSKYSGLITGCELYAIFSGRGPFEAAKNPYLHQSETEDTGTIMFGIEGAIGLFYKRSLIRKPFPGKAFDIFPDGRAPPERVFPQGVRIIWPIEKVSAACFFGDWGAVYSHFVFPLTFQIGLMRNNSEPQCLSRFQNGYSLKIIFPGNGHFR